MKRDDYEKVKYGQPIVYAIYQVTSKRKRFNELDKGDIAIDRTQAAWDTPYFVGLEFTKRDLHIYGASKVKFVGYFIFHRDQTVQEFIDSVVLIVNGVVP